MTAISETLVAVASAESEPTGKPRVRILGSDSNDATPVLVEAWRRLGLDCELVPAREALATLRPGDVAVARLDILPSLDGVEEGLLGVLLLERRGVRVVNTARALLCAHDKLRTARALTAAGVPHPRTAHVVPRGRLTAMRPPLVVKPRFGSWGADVFRCRDDDELAASLREVATRPWFHRHGALAQELLPPYDADLRVVVAGSRVVGAAERVAKVGEWRTNITLGGSPRATTIGPEAEALAVAAADAVGADFVGVDLAPLPGGAWTVVEVNGAVDFDEVYAQGERDPFLAAAEALGLAAAEAEGIH